MICCIYAITHAAEVSRRSAHAIVANAAAAVMVLWPVALATDLENIRAKLADKTTARFLAWQDDNYTPGPT